MTAAALIALLVGAGFGQPQAETIVRYAWQGSRLDPCANSYMGESLLDVAGEMRRRYHRDLGPGCQSPETQVRWLAEQWPRTYPVCAARFAAGDLSAFQRCWGWGHSR